jgi:hypothetical protein
VIVEGWVLEVLAVDGFRVDRVHVKAPEQSFE